MLMIISRYKKEEANHFALFKIAANWAGILADINLILWINGLKLSQRDKLVKKKIFSQNLILINLTQKALAPNDEHSDLKNVMYLSLSAIGAAFCAGTVSSFLLLPQKSESLLDIHYNFRSKKS